MAVCVRQLVADQVRRGYTVDVACPPEGRLGELGAGRRGAPLSLAGRPVARSGHCRRDRSAESAGRRDATRHRAPTFVESRVGRSARPPGSNADRLRAARLVVLRRRRRGLGRRALGASRRALVRCDPLRLRSGETGRRAGGYPGPFRRDTQRRRSRLGRRGDGRRSPCGASAARDRLRPNRRLCRPPVAAEGAGRSAPGLAEGHREGARCAPRPRRGRPRTRVARLAARRGRRARRLPRRRP